MVNLLLMEISSSMVWYVKLLLILSKIFIIYGIYGISLSLFKSYNLISSYINMRKYQIDMGCVLSLENINKELDLIIEDSFNSYIIMNGIVLKEYINEDTENKLNKDICTMVSSSISGSFVNKLSMYYDINSLSEIISRKVFILITSFTIEKNKSK